MAALGLLAYMAALSTADRSGTIGTVPTDRVPLSWWAGSAGTPKGEGGRVLRRAALPGYECLVIAERAVSVSLVALKLTKWDWWLHLVS